MTEAKQLYTDGIITAAELETIERFESEKLFSLHWELRTILYLGILLLTSGVGILVYQNIDTIGHQTILAAIAAAIGACFYYLVKHKQPYRDGEVKNVSPLFDYIGLLGCLLFGTFIGYLQFKYGVFNRLLWLATLLPAALFVYCAYAFDHKGLLALGITGVISTLGLSIAPTQLLYGDNFTDLRILLTATALGLLLIAVALYSSRRRVKPHFSFSYHNFAANLLFVSCLALLFNYPLKLVSFLWLAALCVYFTRYAIAQQSFLFLLLSAIYSYIGLTYVVFSMLLSDNYNDAAFMFGMVYIIASCVGIIFFFIKYKKNTPVKMIAYNKTKLDNLRIIKKAKQWYARQLLPAEQFVAATDRYTVDFYTPNLFIKIGLFIFTWVSIGAAIGLFSLFFLGVLESANSDAAIAMLCLLAAAGCIFLLETLIRQKKLYRSGIDEALLYAALLFTSGAIGSLLPDLFGNASSTMLSFSLLMLPVLAAATIRYGDTFTAILLSLCCYVVFFLLVLKLGAVAKLVMPFALMLLSAALYFLAKKLQQEPHLRYWQNTIAVFQCVALLAFYLSGNYYVIRESSIAFFDLRLAPGQNIPLAPLFYVFTAIVPLLYLFYGLKQKDRLLLWTGLVVMAASALTFKYYFSIGRPEIILTVAGILLIGIAYAAIRYLKTPKHGLTFEEDPDEDSFLQTNAEALLQARTFGHHAQAHPANTTEFGGGSSGGGGATGNW